MECQEGQCSRAHRTRWVSGQIPPVALSKVFPSPNLFLVCEASAMKAGKSNLVVSACAAQSQ